MASSTAFRRGFKAESERLSLAVRRRFGLKPTDSLKPESLADHLGAILVTPEEMVLSVQALKALRGIHTHNWDAVTITNGDSHLIVYNPKQPRRRIPTTLMHELSHLLLEHEPSTIVLYPEGNVALRQEYSPELESEADWMASVLLLPRPALLSIKRLKLSDEQAMDKYGVSPDILKMRWNVSGVAAQTSRWR